MMKQSLRCCFSWTSLLLVPVLIGTGCGWMGTEPTPQEAVLYEDDFVDPTSGWLNELVYDNYYIGYHEPEFYHVGVRAANDRAVIVLPQRSFNDFVTETEVFVSQENTAPSGDFRYGLVVCPAGEQYYGFAISPHTKRWSVLKSSPNGMKALEEGTEDSIQGLAGGDMLRVDAKEPDFTFYINGRLVSQVKDAEYVSGEAVLVSSSRRLTHLRRTSTTTHL